MYIKIHKYIYLYIVTRKRFNEVKVTVYIYEELSLNHLDHGIS